MPAKPGAMDLFKTMACLTLSLNANLRPENIFLRTAKSLYSGSEAFRLMAIILMVKMML